MTDAKEEVTGTVYCPPKVSIVKSNLSTSGLSVNAYPRIYSNINKSPMYQNLSITREYVTVMFQVTVPFQGCMHYWYSCLKSLWQG